MIKRRNICYFVLALLFTACATNESTDLSLLGLPEIGQRTIRFVATPATSALTRAEIDIQPNVFDADEVLQGYVWYEDHVDNADNNSWSPKMTAMAPENNQNDLVLNQSLNWPADPEKKIRFYGLYPENVTKDVTSFTVEADQTTDEKYKLSDLMWAGDHTNNTYLSAQYDDTNAAQNMPFKHKMAKLIVNAVSDGSISGLVVKGITVKDVKRQIGFTPTTGVLGGDGTLADGGDILMTNNGACLLPPQAMAADKILFEVSVTVDGQEKTAKYKLGSGITLAEGYQYTFTLNVGAQALVLTSTIEGWISSSDTHTVTPQAFGSLMMDPVAAETYNGTVHEVMPIVKDANGTQLTQGTHFDYSWYGHKDAGTAVVVATGKDDYSGQKAIQTFTINKAMLTVTAENKTKTYLEDNPVLTVTYSGWLGSDNADCLTNLPQVTTTAEKTSNATARDAADTNPGTPYPIMASGAEAKNYDFTYVDGGLTVYKKPISDWGISPTKWPLEDTDYFEPADTKVLTVGYGSGDENDHGDISLSSTNINIATTDGLTVKAISNGSAIINVTVGDGINYIYEGQKTCNVTVKKKGPATVPELNAYSGSDKQTYLGYYVDANGNLQKDKDSNSEYRIFDISSEGVKAYSLKNSPYNQNFNPNSNPIAPPPDGFLRVYQTAWLDKIYSYDNSFNQYYAYTYNNYLGEGRYDVYLYNPSTKASQVKKNQGAAQWSVILYKNWPK